MYRELLTRYDDRISPKIGHCDENGSVKACTDAYEAYMNGIEYPILGAAFDRCPDITTADIRETGRTPRNRYVRWLRRPDVKKAIGAMKSYTDSAGAEKLTKRAMVRETQNNSRETSLLTSNLADPRSLVSELSHVVKIGISVLIWTGDADYVSNWFVTLDVANAISWPKQFEFAAMHLRSYHFERAEKGTFKRVDNLEFVRVHRARQNVPFYRKCFIFDIVSNIHMLI